MAKRQTKNQQAYQKEILRLKRYAEKLSNVNYKFDIPSLFQSTKRITAKRLKEIREIDERLFEKIATKTNKITGETVEKSRRSIGGYKSYFTHLKRIQQEQAKEDQSKKVDKAEEMEKWIKDIINDLKK